MANAFRDLAVQRDRSCPGVSKVLAEAHLSHVMFRTRVVGSETPLFFCCKCGCYTVSRSAGLTKPCSRSPYHSTIHNRLLASQHPVTKRPLQPPTRVLAAAVLGLLDRSFDDSGHEAVYQQPPVADRPVVPHANWPGPEGGGGGANHPLVPGLASWADAHSSWDLEEENSFDFLS